MAGRLGDILVARGNITEEQLQEALASQGAQRGMLGELLISRELITSSQLGEALAVQFDVPYEDVDLHSINSQVVRLLPEHVLRQRLMAPLSVQATKEEKASRSTTSADGSGSSGARYPRRLRSSRRHPDMPAVPTR